MIPSASSGGKTEKTLQKDAGTSALCPGSLGEGAEFVQLGLFCSRCYHCLKFSFFPLIDFTFQVPRKTVHKLQTCHSNTHRISPVTDILHYYGSFINN